MTVLIKTTPHSYRFQVEESGHLTGTHHSVVNFLSEFTDSRWDNVLGRWTVIDRYRYYNAKTKWCHCPRYDLPRFTAWLDERHVKYVVVEVPLIDGTPVELKLRPTFKAKSELQESAITYLSTSVDPVRGLGIQTGGGKTATGIAGICGIGRRAMITAPRTNLIEQWNEAIFNFTEAKPEDVYVIKGAPSLIKLLKGIDKTLHPKILLASIGTLYQWVADKDATVNYPPFEDLCSHFGIGVWIRDEAHEHFHTNLMMDLRANPAVTVLSSATFDHSNATVKRIFENHYPPKIRFGEQFYKKYVDIFAYAWSSGYGAIPAHAYKSKEGYSHAKLEDWFLRHPSKLNQYWEEVISPLVHGHYINRDHTGKRCLMLFSTVAMCEWVAKRLEKEIQGYKAGVYVSGVEKSMLGKVDFIISTPGSAGTGTDIKDLLTVLVFISIKSPPRNKQILGRARELPDGMTPHMAYVCDLDIRQQVDYHRARQEIFERLALNFHSLQL